MNRLNKRRIKKPHVKEFLYVDKRGEKPNYSYVYIPINKKEKYHHSQTRRLIEKNINNRFATVEKDDYYIYIDQKTNKGIFRPYYKGSCNSFLYDFKF